MWFDLGFDNNCCFPHENASCTDDACETLVCAVDPLCCQNDWEQACADLAAIVCGDTCQVFSGITLIGGYAGLGAPDPNDRDPALYETILTGDLWDNDLPMAGGGHPSLGENSLHVLTANGSDLVVDGFVIRGGVTNTNDEVGALRWGPGLLVIAADVSVHSCTFTGNVTAGDGGAVALYLGSQVVMTDCVVSGNRGRSGGGIVMADECHLTLINCEISGNVSSNQGGGLMVSTLSELVAIDSTFSDNINETDSGGGIHVRNASTFALTNCTFTGNDGKGEGGGLYVKIADGTIEGCTFEGNTAGRGGGVFLETSYGGVTIDGCVFDSNTAGRGGALWDAHASVTVAGTLFTGNNADEGGAVLSTASGTYSDCTFAGNWSTTFAGAFRDESNSTFINCLFVDNVSDRSGAMSGGSPTLINCTFLSNVALTKGGAVGGGGSIHFANCLFAGNTAVENGGAVSLGNPDVVFSNCTLVANTTPGQAGGIYVTQGTASLVNCVAWGNTDASGATEPAQITGESTTLSVAYSCIEGLTGALGGAGNIGADPMFVDPLGPDGTAGTEDDDLRLLAGSPGIDAGHNWGVLPDYADLDADGDTAELTPFDLDGNPRFVADPADSDPGCGTPAVVDMGAYEFQIGGPFDIRLGDIDGDGVVGINDFLDLLAQWGACTTECCLADLDFDGDVGIADFLILLGNWTP